MRQRVGEKRYLKHPETGEKKAYSVIRDELYVPALDEEPLDAGSWGTYRFGAWLEEDLQQPGRFFISFPYWRGQRFAGQWTLRADVDVVKDLVRGIEERGWLADYHQKTDDG